MSERHLSPEALTAMVGGNPPSPDQKAHLLACEACRSSLLQAPALEQEADRLLFLGAEGVPPPRGFGLKKPEPWGRNIALSVAAGVAAWLLLPLPTAAVDRDRDQPVVVTAELAAGPGDAVVVKYTASTLSSGRLFAERGGALEPLAMVTLQAGAHELPVGALPEGRIYLAVRARGGPPDWDSSLSDLRAQTTLVTIDPRPRTSSH